jgi:hypothetical protein
MAGFMQIIEFQASRTEEIEERGRPPRTRGSSAPTFRRILATADRERPGTYLTIVEFDSTNRPWKTRGRPETSAFAAKMAGRCDGPAIFRKLDVPEEVAGEADAGG